MASITDDDSATMEGIETAESDKITGSDKMEDNDSSFVFEIAPEPDCNLDIASPKSDRDNDNDYLPFQNLSVELEEDENETNNDSLPENIGSNTTSCENTGTPHSPENTATPVSPANTVISHSPENTATSASPANTVISHSPENTAASASPANTVISHSPENTVISPHENTALSPSPENIAPSLSPENTAPSPSPENTVMSPSPKNIVMSPSSENTVMSPAQENTVMSPSHKNTAPTPSPETTLISPSSENTANSVIINPVIPGVSTDDESTIDQTELKKDNNDPNLLIISAADIKQEIEEEPVTTFTENATTYLDDFLFSTGSSFAHDSDSMSNDVNNFISSEEKGLCLKRFPRIVKALETADFEILQALYLVLFLQSAWDTEKNIIQRILEFSGFNCDQNSEDFYTRKLNLCTLSNKVLFRIKNLLGVQTSWFGSAESEKDKLETVDKILEFLAKPARKSRQRRRYPATNSRQSAHGRKHQSPKKPVVHAKTLSNAENSRTYSQNKVGLQYVRPGPLSFKLQLSYVKDSKFMEREKSLKEKIAKGIAPEIKVILKKLQWNENHSPRSSKVNKIKEKVKNNNESKAVEPVFGEEKIIVEEKKNETVELKKNETAESKKNETTESKKNEAAEEKKNETAEKKVDPIEAKAQDVVKIKLREFPPVLSSIEGTPEKLLFDMYYLLFLEKKHELEAVKEKILDFDGFPFAEDSADFKNRKAALSEMTESTVKDITRALYLDAKITKEATELHLLAFLKQPQEKLLRPTVVAPGMLSDCEVDLDDLSDSDDSIVCEIVPKKVECIDLLSSDEEGETKGSKKSSPSKKEFDKSAKSSTVVKTPVAVASPAATPAVSETSSNGVRTLRDFVTIKKIVETHPNEYLVDIFNLLYMKNHQPDTLRKDILDFSGFKFDKTSPEYTKRKQFLDRMLYNSVRRIYNTLIHNTREVKVFSKPTMISEIFQFLLKLPDTDTSVPPPRPTVTKSYSTFANVTNIVASENLKNKDQAAKLSDLKRVFQRVACFPCEYLVDVHKLLFMTDCEMKDIRTNIFAFRGFNFEVGSSEFNQRKMFLEYLTFHSLRKISSVLTTKTVDLRNSTKHELASHLTEVLKEYTKMSYEEEPIGTDLGLKAVPTSPQKTTPTTTETTTTSPSSSSSSIEQIVVTPIISSVVSSVAPSVNQPVVSTVSTTVPISADIVPIDSVVSRINAEVVPIDSVVSRIGSEDMDVTVSSSTSSENASLSQVRSKGPTTPTATKKSPKESPGPVSSSKDPLVNVKKEPAVANLQQSGTSSPGLRTDSPSSSTSNVKAEPQKSEPQKPTRRKRKQQQMKQPPPPPPPPSNSLQFQDINLPEIEKYRKIYKSNFAATVSSTMSSVQAPSPTVVSSSTLAFPPEYVLQQVPRPLGPLIGPGGPQQIPLMNAPPFGSLITSTSGQPLTRPQLMPPGVPIHSMPMHSFSQQIPMQNPTYFVQSQSYLNMDGPDCVIPVECVLQEGNNNMVPMPAAKRFKTMIPKPPDDPGFEDSLVISNPKSIISTETENPSSSLQLKIRDAMTKTLDDEEDCDKPLATLVGHPNDKVLKQQICEIVENTDLQDISINGVIQKIFNMYPKFNLNYRKEFIKSTLRSLLYRLGDQDSKQDGSSSSSSKNTDCSVTTTNEQSKTSLKLQKSS